MEIERSYNHNYKVAYLLRKSEIEVIIKSLKSEIKNLKRQIERTKNNPKNEGQGFYLDKVDLLESKITEITEMIELFVL